MLSGLILTAFLMGLGGVPHCAAMCGAACAAAFPKGVPLASLAGRCVAYALLGAVAAASVGLVAQWGRQISFVQPLWVLAQGMALVLGLLLLISGRIPAQIETAGQGIYRSLQARWQSSGALQKRPWLAPVWPFVAGMGWAILPCGLLYAAVTVAALAPSAWGGALVMLAFALPGAVGVWGANSVLRRLMAWRGQGLAVSPGLAAPVIWLQQRAPGSAAQGSGRAASPCGPDVPDVPAGQAALIDPIWAVRLSGLMLTAMAAWALYHQVLDQWRAWCA
jgi:sulfite exporter TauE/SafE